MESTPESKERIDSFMKEYKALVDKFNVDFVQYPVYMPDEHGGFRTVIQVSPIDTTKLSKPSPFIGK